MATKLKEYYPMIREREEVLAEIARSEVLQDKFDGWEPEQQDEFLNICTGVKGLKLLYDGFFKEVMNRSMYRSGSMIFFPAYWVRE